MKNKSVTYALLGVVAAVWGVIFYRIFSGLGESGADAPTAHYVPKERQRNSQVKDTFEMIADYRDPFLGKVSVSYSSDGNPGKVIRKPKKKEVATPPAPVIDWSFVAYLGTIKNKHSNKEIGILRVNGSEVMVGSNDRVGDIMVMKVSRDSAVIQYQGIKKVLGKSY